MGGGVGHDTDASAGIDVADNNIVVARAKVCVAWSPGADCISPAIGVIAFASCASRVGIVFVVGGRMID